MAAINRSTDMTTGSIWKRMVSFAVPVFLGNLCQQLYNTVDSVIVGKFVGKQALAAVAVAGSIWAPVALLGIGCLLALSPLSAQFVGSGRPDRAAHLLRQGLWLTLAMSVVLVGF